MVQSLQENTCFLVYFNKDAGLQSPVRNFNLMCIPEYGQQFLYVYKNKTVLGKDIRF